MRRYPWKFAGRLFNTSNNSLSLWSVVCVSKISLILNTWCKTGIQCELIIKSMSLYLQISAAAIAASWHHDDPGVHVSCSCTATVSISWGRRRESVTISSTTSQTSRRKNYNINKTSWTYSVYLSLLWVSRWSKHNNIFTSLFDCSFLNLHVYRYIDPVNSSDNL